MTRARRDVVPQLKDVLDEAEHQQQHAILSLVAWLKADCYEML